MKSIIIFAICLAGCCPASKVVVQAPPTIHSTSSTTKCHPCQCQTSPERTQEFARRRSILQASRADFSPELRGVSPVTVDIVEELDRKLLDLALQEACAAEQCCESGK